MNYRDVVMDHYSNPRNKKRMEDSNYLKQNTKNTSCIDNLDIYCLIDDNIIKDITFDGEACAISISSSSIMTTLLKGKTIREAKEIIDNIDNMLNDLDYNKDLIKEASVYENVKNTSRKTCAWLPYDGIKKIIEK